MKRIDELIKKETKLEKKKDALLAELNEVDTELSKIKKLRTDAEKILTRLQTEQRKLDELLGQVPQRGRKKNSDSNQQDLDPDGDSIEDNLEDMNLFENEDVATLQQDSGQLYEEFEKA